MKSYISPETNDWMHQGHKSSNLHSSNSDQHLSVDQILNVMNQINSSVKAGEFTSQLANAIFLLCQQLKANGQHLEQTHKNELNTVFVSLRQACCRDSGQLGTPCRLKIMELVELRAMGWRPSFAHTQYYLNRPEHLNTNMSSSNVTPEPTTTPVSAPPFGAVPINPFTQYVPPSQAPPMFLPSEVHQNPQLHQVQNPLHAPSFYLIPAAAAAGGWSRPAMVPASTAALMPPGGGLLGHSLGGNPGVNPAIPSPLDLDLAWMAQQSLNINKQLPLKNPAKFTANMLNAVQKVAAASKPLQLREEFTIRNCDSGKIMGVKGRRVAVVEELSKTVISFQKVDPKSRDRTLTITGSTPESIEHAKKLIQDTIRRNVSPNRSDANGKPSEAAESDDEDDDDGPGISIETTKDGTLKLCCDDPQVLQAAQAALSEYLNRVGRSSQARLSAEERELRKERRKSMPLSMPQSASTSAPTAKEWRSMTGSTPNLASLEAAIEMDPKQAPKKEPKSGSSDSHRYNRADIVKLRESSENDPTIPLLTQIRQIQQTLPEIMRQ